MLPVARGPSFLDVVLKGDRITKTLVRVLEFIDTGWRAEDAIETG